MEVAVAIRPRLLVADMAQVGRLALPARVALRVVPAGRVLGEPVAVRARVDLLGRVRVARRRQDGGREPHRLLAREPEDDETAVCVGDGDLDPISAVSAGRDEPVPGHGGGGAFNALHPIPPRRVMQSYRAQLSRCGAAQMCAYV